MELRTEVVNVAELLEQLRGTRIFSGVDAQTLECIDTVEVVSLEAGERAVQMPDRLSFLVLLSGRLQVQPPPPKMPIVFSAGESFGEVPLLTNKRLRIDCIALEAWRIVRFQEDEFWRLMVACPGVRANVLGDMALRLESYQSQEMQREKLSSLGTLAAGLMHELKNPGTAAIRAASQMRENLSRLQQVSLKLSRARLSNGQLECLGELQKQALGAACCRAMSSLEQSDAEEALEQQLEDAGVVDGWRLAPTLVSMGMTADELRCAREMFTGEQFSDSLNWLEALMSSVQLVGTIEVSLGRVQDLIKAVKIYSYEDQNAEQTVDLHATLQSTLLILGHKLRQREITVERDFAQDLPAIHMRSGGLNQVWTNLLDNAIDASPDGGVIVVRTWLEPGSVMVAIEDHGKGISSEDASRVFQPFFTTKPAGVGTGLGLDIVHRIVSTKLGGDVSFVSSPGKTVFTVRLPLDWKTDSHLRD